MKKFKYIVDNNTLFETDSLVEFVMYMTEVGDKSVIRQLLYNSLDKSGHIIELTTKV